MNKKGQFIFAFVLISIAVVASFAFLYYIGYIQSGKEFKPGLFSQLSLTSESASFKNYVQSCLEETTREGLDYFGVKESSQPLIEQYIKAELPECVDVQAFEEFGMVITPEQVKPSVLITDKSVLVDVDWPITLEKQGATSVVEDFNYYLKRERSAEFTFNADDTTTEPQRIVTEDGDAELIVPQGTKVYDKDGNLLDEVTLKVLDKNFDGLNNGVVVGMVVYDGIPDGARFSPPVTIIVNYREEDIPPGVSEEELSIAWYDKENGLWKSVPSDVDTVNNKVSGSLSHFTTVAPVADCTNSERKVSVVNWQKIGPEIIYMQTCGTDYENCMEATQLRGWESGNGFHEVEVECQEPVIQEINTDTPAGKIPYEICKLEDWDKDDIHEVSSNCLDACYEEVTCRVEGFESGDGLNDFMGITCQPPQQENDEPVCINPEPATPMTYGYGGTLGAGGIGSITFNVDTDGDACVMTDAAGELVYRVDTNCFGDTCYEDFETGGVFNPPISTPTIPTEPVTIIDITTSHGYDKYWTDTELVKGTNSYWTGVKNDNGDGCAQIEATIWIVGTGLTWINKQGDVIPANILTGDLQTWINKLCCCGGGALSDPDSCNPKLGSNEGCVNEEYPGCSEMFSNYEVGDLLSFLTQCRYASKADPSIDYNTVEDCCLKWDTNNECENLNIDLPPLPEGTCSGTERDNVCPVGCYESNDIDCDDLAVCSDNDGECSEGCDTVNDKDCCEEKGSGGYWLETPTGFGCYPGDYNKGCSPGQECNIKFNDECCPNWCTNIDDADCGGCKIDGTPCHVDSECCNGICQNELCGGVDVGPDADGDGVHDDDHCPQEAGSSDHKGCPDTDGDGVFDDVDNCKYIKNSRQTDRDINGVGDTCEPGYYV